MKESVALTLKPAVRVCRRIAEVGREAWDACADNPDHAANPFIAAYGGNGCQTGAANASAATIATPLKRCFMTLILRCSSGLAEAYPMLIVR